MEPKIESWNYDLNCNQKVMEIRKDGKIENKVFKENFETFRKLKRALWRRKENGVILALVDYMGDNSNGFTFGLSRTSRDRSLWLILFKRIITSTSNAKIR